MITSPSCSEQQHLKKLREGDGSALDYFYKQHSIGIYRKIKKMVKIEIVAEEILQDVFVKIWDKRYLIDPNLSFTSYLYTIAQNLVYDFYRKAARDVKVQEELKTLNQEFYTHVEEDIQLKEMDEILSQAIDNLPSQQKLVFKLCKIEGKSYEEVSATLGISTSTINGHIVKATKSIKGYILKVWNTTISLVVVLSILGWLMN